MSFLLDIVLAVADVATDVLIWAGWRREWAGWRSEDVSQCEKAIDNVIHQHRLARIARKSPLAEARLMALRRLTDPSELARVAKKAKAWDVRKQAIKKLDPREFQPLLENLATNDHHPNVRQAACEKLNELRNRHE